MGYVYNVVLVIYEPLKEYLPISSVGGTMLLFLIAAGILVMLCFFCGLAARRAIARKFSQIVEKHLVMVFPKYAIYKDILAGNVADDAHGPSLIPVTIQFDDAIRIGYEAGRTERGLVIVYLPGSPDPWMGELFATLLATRLDDRARFDSTQWSLPRAMTAKQFTRRFLTRMYARFGAVAGQPYSDKGSGCNSLRFGSRRLYE